MQTAAENCAAAVQSLSAKESVRAVAQIIRVHNFVTPDNRWIGIAPRISCHCRSGARRRWISAHNPRFGHITYRWRETEILISNPPKLIPWCGLNETVAELFPD